MKCSCGGHLKTLETRNDERRKECETCGRRFMTVERIVREVSKQQAVTRSAKPAATCKRVRSTREVERVVIPPQSDRDIEHGRARRRAEDILMARSMGISLEELS